MEVKVIRLLPLFLFIIIFISPFIAWRVTQKVVKAEVRRSYDKEVQIIKHWMQDRLNLYQPIALGMRIFFESSDKLTQSEWSAYIKMLKLMDQYSAISSLSYIECVKAEDGDAYSVKYVEPLDASGENKEAIGSNISSKQRLELFNSIRGEEPVPTQRFILITTPKKGFEIILPVYRKKAISTTIEERSAAIKGFIQIEFAGSRLFQDIFYTGDSTNLSFEIYSGVPSNENFVYDQDSDISVINPNYQPEIITQDTFEFNGQTWYILAATKSDFKLTPFQEKLPLIVLGSGLLFGFTLLGIYIYMKKRDRASL